jgi:hypothetical protein
MGVQHGAHAENTTANPILHKKDQQFSPVWGYLSEYRFFE